MTENRHFAGWARILVGFFALAGLVGLTGCGGGSGSPNNPFNTPGDLTIVPNPMTVYSVTPATVTIEGGQPPYTIFSSDQILLPVQTNVSGSTQTVVPNAVGAVTTVTLTVRDARGTSAQSSVTINPSPLINSLTIKPDAYIDTCPNPAGSSNPIDTSASSFICAGQTASVAVTTGAGRAVRFDVIQGAFQISTELPGQPPMYALTYTVPADSNGTAVARIRALPGASAQTAIIQATDVSTGAFVRGTFVIVPVTNANAADLVVLPTTVKITGPDNQTCSSGFPSTYFIYGGQPPYTVSNSFPQAALISPTVVQNSGGGFTVTTQGVCVDPVTFIITDSAGHSVTVTLSNVLGTTAPPTTTSPNPIVVTPSSIPTLGCGVSTNVVATGGGTVSTTGNTQTVTPATSFFVSVSRPDLLSAVPSNPDAGAPITLLRLGGTPVQGAGGPVNVSLLISDGGQTKTVNVPVTGAACP